MSFDIDEIINRVSIVEYISKYVTLKKKGANHWGLCPFHNEKTPSFSVSEEKKIFKCFGCGIGGNVLTFVHEYEKIEWAEAIRTLADYAGVKEKENSVKKFFDPKKEKKEQIFLLQKKISDLFYQELEKSNKAKEYLKKRKLSIKTIKYLKIGFAPDTIRFLEGSSLFQKDMDKSIQRKKMQDLYQCGLIGEKNGNSFNRFRNRIVFPIMDIQGNIAGFGGRTLDENSGFAKYLNSPESIVFEKKNILYNLYQARDVIRKEKNVFLVEGYFDVAGLVNSGIFNTIAPMGTSFTENQAKLLKRYTDKVTIFFDSDSAGIEAALKSLKILKEYKFEIFIIKLPEKLMGKDPYDLSVLLPLEEFFSILDDPINEIQFILWYYFSFKYNINQLEGKRKSISEFFEYVSSLDTEWEKEEFIRNASKILFIPFDTFLRDYRSMSPQKEIIHSPKTKSTLIHYETQTKEKELLALLLKFPEFWEKKKALTEISWKNESAELLFGFFRDRLSNGEYWPWEELYKTGTFLSKEMNALLADIIFTYQDQFSENDNPLKYEKSFNSIILSIKIKEIEDKINELKNKIKVKEVMKEDIEEESIEIGNLIREKNHLEKVKRT